MMSEARYGEVLAALEEADKPDAFIYEASKGRGVYAGDVTELGDGDSRSVYGVDVEGRPPTALKVLHDHPSAQTVWQMEAELACLEKMQGNALVLELVRVSLTSPTLWIEVERADKAPDERGSEANHSKKFLRATGIPWASFKGAAYAAEHPARGRATSDDAYELRRRLTTAVPPTPVTPKAEVFLQAVQEVVKGCNLYVGELGTKANWGFTEDGAIKLLDMGVTADFPAEGESHSNPDLKRRLMR